MYQDLKAAVNITKLASPEINPSKWFIPNVNILMGRASFSFWLPADIDRFPVRMTIVSQI